MKDAYSFHADEACLEAEYNNMFETYKRIFTRLGLKFRPVEADTGSIGGSASHEFHVLAESGEDLIAHCSACEYAANVEMSESTRDIPAGTPADLAGVETPNATTAEDVAAFLNSDIAQLVKTLVYRVEGGEHDGQVVAACVRGDDQLQEIKLIRALGATSIEMASDEEIKSVGGITGFVGPVGLSCRRIFDKTLEGAVGLVAGANKRDMHLTGLDMNRDESAAGFADLRQTRAGDSCPKCGGAMELSRGIEVGHVFALGTVYSEPMEVLFQNQEGQRTTATMGCYGIGVSRLMAAIVEQCNDENGIAWPAHLAPFQATIITMGKSDTGREASEKLYRELLNAGIEVIWDDRNERPGVKFKDAELMGLPVHIVVGDRGLERGVIEVKLRDGEKEEIEIASALDKVRSLLAGSSI